MPRTQDRAPASHYTQSAAPGSRGSAPPPPPRAKARKDAVEAAKKAAGEAAEAAAAAARSALFASKPPAASSTATTTTLTPAARSARFASKPPAASSTATTTPKPPEARSSASTTTTTAVTPTDSQGSKSCQKAWGIVLATLGSVCTAGSAVASGLLLNASMASAGTFKDAFIAMYNADPILTISLCAAFVIGIVLAALGGPMVHKASTNSALSSQPEGGKSTTSPATTPE